MQLFNLLIKNRALILMLTRRDIEARYRGSALGTAWMLAAPLVTLAVYTFVFSFVFQGKWNGIINQGYKGYAIILFSGLVIFNFFSECLNRAPNIVRDNVNYVKKIVFPLELLSVIYCLSSMFQMFVNYIILLAFYVLLIGVPPWTVLIFPFFLLPLFIFSLAITWLFSSLGVFLPDIKQVTGIMSTVLMFISPVFYSITAIPEKYRYLMYLNPLTFVLEQNKDLLFRGLISNIDTYIYSLIASLFFMVCCYIWFMKTKKAFADVL